jgi:hypothetical protein
MLATETRQHLTCEVRQIDRLLPKGAARNIREFQEVVDQVSHPFRRLLDGAQRHPALVVQPVGVVLEEVAEPLDRGERAAQVVGDGVAERLELPVGSLGLRQGPIALGGPEREVLVEEQQAGQDLGQQRIRPGDFVDVLVGDRASARCDVCDVLDHDGGELGLTHEGPRAPPPAPLRAGGGS